VKMEMMNVNDSDSRLSRAHLVPAFKELSAWIAEERQRLEWIPRGTPRTVRGIKTKGGFYVHRPKNASLSFAVDESLHVGCAENARPILLRPGQCIAYRDLNPDQRAAYLHRLSDPTAPASRCAFATRLHTAALEWMLFIERADPGAITEELLEVISWAERAEEAPLMRLLALAAYFQNRVTHLIVLEGIVAAGFQMDGGMARLLLFDFAEDNRPIWPESALAIRQLFGGHADPRFSEPAFQERFLQRFRVLHPDGLPISAALRQVEVEYRLHCIEIRGERCRLRVRDALESTLVALGEVTAPLLSEVRLDPVKLKRIADETLRSEAFLADRNQSSPEPSLPPSPPRNSESSADLDELSVEVLHVLIQRPEWSEFQFNALAKSRGRMPFAILEKLNGWAIENFGEPLLEGSSPVVVNANIIKGILNKYAKTN
jgi:hypothetical protein